MTREEFNDWLATLSDTFPSLGRYLDRVESPAKITAGWFGVVESLEPSEAAAYTSALVEGSEEAPRYPDDWATFPGAVRRWCGNRRSYELPSVGGGTYEDPRYRCLACRDRGYGVEVLNPAWVDRHRSEIADGLPADWWREARVWCRTHRVGPLVFGCDCSCSAWERMPVKRRELGHQRYNARRHLLVQYGNYPTPQEIAAFVENTFTMEEAHAWQP